MPGPLDHSPADIVRYLIIKLSQGTLPSDNGVWPVYASNVPDTPDSVITTTDTVGLHQGRTQNEGRVQERYGFQVAVRSVGHTNGYSKAQAIVVALDESAYQDLIRIDTTDYIVWAISRTTGVLAVGKETPDSKRDLFTVNGTVSINKQ